MATEKVTSSQVLKQLILTGKYPMFVGEMGVQRVAQGNTELYRRKSSYCYIEFDSSYGAEVPITA